jgi:hypothetical protein
VTATVTSSYSTVPGAGAPNFTAMALPSPAG